MNEASERVAAVYRGTYESRARNGLALEASGIEYELREGAGGWAIVVAAGDATEARQELDSYGAEHVVAPTAPASPWSGWAVLAGYVTLLLAVTLLQRYRAFGLDWFEAGGMQAGLVRDGELWRTITALSLHVDPGHLLANLIMGGVFGLVVGKLLGSGVAWISILLAGSAGNLLASLLRPAGHASIGASTAVFAALGLLAGHAWVTRRGSRESTLAGYGPVIGAIVLLSYLGASGERTDVLAHVSGFFCGLLAGSLFGWRGNRTPLGRKSQLASGIVAVATVVTAWFLALTQSRES